ncbi:MAG: RIP metalloprotease RseP [Deltaproteobacteria bacterium]|nr:RIP metalloprotease RseP [Deltaproteobacteria bacterium]
MTVLAFIFVIGILVFIHELGHFLVAKWKGVRVEKFSLGFGKKLVGFRRGETEYLVSLLPLGGYVKLFGEGGEGSHVIEDVIPGSKADKIGFKPGDKILKIDDIDLASFPTWRELENTLRTNNEKEYIFEIERLDDRITIKSMADSLGGLKVFSEKEYPRSFSNQSIISRLMIVIAGPFMNFVLPFLFLPIVFLIGISVPAYLESSPVVGYVEPNSAASKAGFEKGDVVIEVNGKGINTWRDLNITFQSNPDIPLNILVNRNGDMKSIEFKSSPSSQGIVQVGISEPLEAKIGDVIEGSPASRSGALQKGDQILAVDDEKITDWYQMSSIIRDSKGKEVSLLVKRGDTQFKINITPEIIEGSNYAAVGITPEREQILKKYGFIDSIIEGIKEAAKLIFEVTVLLFSFLYKLITGKISLGTAGKSLAGPLLIAKVSGSAAESGIASLMQFTAFISINLAIINLFPIPMLDGGHVLYLAIESIKRKPLSQRTLEISQRIGFTLLIFIMFMAIFNDITRLKGSIIESLSRILEAFR